MAVESRIDKETAPEGRRGSCLVPRQGRPVVREKAENEGFRRERRQKEDGADLLSVLIRTRDEEEGCSGMTDLQLRDEVITLLTAGHETSALTLMYALHLLAEHPELLRRRFLYLVHWQRPPPCGFRLARHRGCQRC